MSPPFFDLLVVIITTKPVYSFTLGKRPVISSCCSLLLGGCSQDHIKYQRVHDEYNMKSERLKLSEDTYFKELPLRGASLAGAGASVWMGGDLH